MVKYINTRNNCLLKLIKKRHKNVSMDTVRVSLAKSEQVFLCCNQWNSFNGTDLSWALRVGRKSFIQRDADCFHLLILKFLAIILKFSLVTLLWFFSMLYLSMCDLWSLSLWFLIRSCMQRVHLTRQVIQSSKNP